MASPAETSDARPRLLLTAVAVPIVGAAVFGPAWAVPALLGAAIAVAGYEFGILARSRSSRIAPPWQAATAVAGAASLYVAPLAAPGARVWMALAGAGAGALLASGLRRLRAGPLQGPRDSVHVLALGVLYAGVLPAFMAVLHRDAGAVGPWWVASTLAAAWGGDIGGYVVGRLAGRHRMAPTLSPAKTWEGAGGSLALGWSGAFGLARAGRLAVSPVGPGAIALIAQLLAQAGDLYESALKRAAGVHDSSRVLGPQGGLLDVIDGLCFAGPWMYLAYRLLA